MKLKVVSSYVNERGENGKKYFASVIITLLLLPYLELYWVGRQRSLVLFIVAVYCGDV